MSALLSLRSATKRFGGLVAVNELSFDVHAGEVVGLLGPNGSGKTTAMNLISGALPSNGGEILFQGQPIHRLKSHQIARLGIARTFQLVKVLGSMSCSDNVIAGMAFKPQPLFGKPAAARALQLLEQVGLAEFAQVPAGDLTYINQKRLELARALALEPKILLLDEWLAGLNPTELQQGIALIQQLQATGLTILMVEHVMDAVHALCSRCVVMNAGAKIADGPTAQVLKQAEVVRAYLGEDEEHTGEAQHA
ncbi:ABC transporter ATP-binding protein [Comamonas testosteroni]|uniref:ABC transporter ATP-binding protein n=1 Tax=Comamonas testosteroni TaxID=285 RepID=A0A373FP32_COMTE|nr:ABC transporter ATP-binding protein [Comamonas testosteroni]RGE45109.1 ABC transporter ATP-binding protein [Comamonas testosteroni]